MAEVINNAPVKWSMSRDREGNRDYKVTWKVKVDSIQEGPATALTADGLAQPGDFWTIGSDFDLWATCKLDAQVSALQQNGSEGYLFYNVEQTFSTKGDDKRCKDEQIDNPILRPQEISGGCQKYQEEATYDRFGKPLLNSAFEMLHGPQVEFDKTRGHVKVQQFVPLLQASLCYGMMDTVNMLPLWGFPPRCVKLSNFSWSRKFYGTCLIYFERTFEFDIRSDTFDKLVYDEATKAIGGAGSRWSSTTGAWVFTPISGAVVPPNYVAPPGPGALAFGNPNYLNPQHFIRFTDRQGQASKAILDGFGYPAGAPNGYGCITATSVNEDTEVDEVDVLFGGFGYITAPEVVFIVDGPQPLTQATATAAVNSKGQVTGITVTGGGFGYDPEDPPLCYLYTGGPAQIQIEKYPENDFTLLGIPLQLDSLS